MLRGLALYEKNRRSALADLAKATSVGVRAIWPYLLLAGRALQTGKPAEALRLAEAGEEQPGPVAARAALYELIAICRAELGQSQELVVKNFRQALALDPDNDQIRQNAEIANSTADGDRAARKRGRRLVQPPPLEPDGLRAMDGNAIANRLDAFAVERREAEIMGRPARSRGSVPLAAPL